MRAALILLLAVALLGAGCTRAHYRRSADRETYPIIAEHIVAPADDIGRTRVEPDPASRLSDPFNPDHPPKPPDDASAAIFMERPGGMRGSRTWLRDGATDQIEPPDWKQALNLTDKGVLKLDADRSVELALLNSREYQTALENVYIVALRLTLDRFEFDMKWFGRNTTAFTHFGTSSLPNESNALNVESHLGFSRNLAAGGQILVDFANTLVYEYTGKDVGHVSSSFAASLIQPLLRNAGRAVRLNTLTQSERDVLYAVRNFARFRKSFWSGVAVQSGGYLDLLLLVQTLRNNQANLKRVEENHRLYTEMFLGGKRSKVELDQIFLNLLQARLNVLNSEIALQSALDRFKVGQLSLPAHIPVELDDAPLQRFVLVAADLEKLRDDLDNFRLARLKQFDTVPSVKEFGEYFAALHAFADKLPAALDQAAADLMGWGEQLDKPARPSDDAEQRSRDKAKFDELKNLIPELARGIAKRTRAIDEQRAAFTEATRKEAHDAFLLEIPQLLLQLDSIISLQTQARVYRITLPEIEYKAPEALAIAHENRLDLQNRLAVVTDAWRLVRVAANALRGELNIVANAKLGTDPDHNRPFDFAAEASRYSVGVNFDGPLNRMAERNQYRLNLILYQRAKRSYMELSDQIEAAVRQDLRQLERQRISFEISRQSLIAAARAYENASLEVTRAKGNANDSATLTLLQTLNSLLDARNALTANYINFEQQRVQLLLDLEELQMDSRGFPINANQTLSTPLPLPPANADSAVRIGVVRIGVPVIAAEPLVGP